MATFLKGLGTILSSDFDIRNSLIIKGQQKHKIELYLGVNWGVNVRVYYRV